jgi:cellulose synthase/poly-beta-1,6-N-acetylglucosamine synthase-like glycosyltransferase
MIALLAWLCIIPPGMALLYFSLEVFCGLRPVIRPGPAGPQPSVAIVIPAHNEALLVSETVASLVRHSGGAAQIIVVADNCSDETGALAAAAGALVLTRSDATRRGKGYALAFARDHLAIAPPDTVVVLDADCQFLRGSAVDLAAYAATLQAPVQAVNLLRAPRGSSPLVLLSNLAFLIKNLVRARGLYRLGGGLPLFGTGMAFPWSIFSKLELATSDSVEDLQLAVELAWKGVKVHFWEGAKVVSEAAEVRDSLGQRGRWEHGFLRTAARHGLPMLARGLLIRSRHLFTMGAHLVVPPFALLISGTAIVLLLLGASGYWTQEWLPFIVLAALLAVALMATGTAWLREGRQIAGLGVLARAPLYLLWKVPIYIRLFTARQTQWNRTRRLNEDR